MPYLNILKCNGKEYFLGLKMSKKKGHSLFWNGLILGLLTGIIGNLFVAYLMKVFDYLNYPLWTWIAATITSFLGIMLLVWHMWKKIEKSSDES